jgi:uncharacterized phiE125 gp8 family phage protein
MALDLITAPAVEPVSLDEAKAHLRVSTSDTDDLISIYIRAAREYCEGPYGFLGRALVTQTWRLTLDEFPAGSGFSASSWCSQGEIQIPLPPLQSVTSVAYDDANSVEQIVSPALYFVDTVSQPGWLLPVNASWPTPLNAANSVRITFVAGYPASTDSPPDLAANVPFNVKAAMLLMIGNMFENREDAVAGIINALPFGAEALLRPHRIQLAMA